MSSKDIDKLCDKLNNLSIFENKEKQKLCINNMRGLIFGGTILDKLYDDWLNIYNELSSN
jgi:D-Tyr-tRNAtyr deacylase